MAKPSQLRVPVRVEPQIPLWWKLWFAFCALIGLGLLGVAVWAVITLVNHVTA